MARPISNKDTIKKSTINHMQGLKIYRAEYDMVIDVYAGLLSQYITQSQKVKNIDYETRSDLLLSTENLRKDVLAYSAQLGLTPAAMRKIAGEQKAGKQSKLAEALRRNASG